jgi:hypothetical protein
MTFVKITEDQLYLLIQLIKESKKLMKQDTTTNNITKRFALQSKADILDELLTKDIATIITKYKDFKELVELSILLKAEEDAEDGKSREN